MMKVPLEEHLLVAHDDVAHWIEAKERPEWPVDGSIDIQDRGAEEPEAEQVANDVAQIAEVDGERGERESQPKRKHELNEEGQHEEEGGGREPTIPDHEEEQDRQGQQEVEEIREDGDRRKNLRRKEHLLEEPAAAYKDGRCFEDRGLKEGPGQDAAGEEEEVGLHLFRPIPGQEVSEDDSVGEEIQERVDEAPDESQDAPAVPRLELSRDKALDEGPVAKERLKLCEDLWPRAQALLA